MSKMYNDVQIMSSDTKEPNDELNPESEDGRAKVETDVMTLSEVAAYLKVAERTVLRMVHAGEIPCAKVGGQWRFLRSVLDDWLLSRMRFSESTAGERHAMPGTGAPGADGPASAAAAGTPGGDALRVGHRLSRFVHEDRVQLDIPGGLDKRDVLSRLAAPLVSSGIVVEAAGFLSSLLERESIISTAVAPDVALPHLRRPDAALVRGTGVSIGVSPDGVDFDALDGRPSRLFVLLVSQTEDVHLTLLAQCAAVLRDSEMVARLIAARHPSEVVRHLIEADYRLLLSRG